MARPVERPNRYFAFLRRLRADGRSNMYGAIPYLAAAFGIDRNESFRIVCEWIDVQEAAGGSAPVPKAAVPAERAVAPTLFDPAPSADAPPVPAPHAKRKVVKRASRPVKQGFRPAKEAAPSRKPRRASRSRAA